MKLIDIKKNNVYILFSKEAIYMKGIDELKEGVDYAALGGGFYKFLSLKKLGRFAEENKDRLIPVHFEQLLMDSLGAINLDGILVLFHEK